MGSAPVNLPPAKPVDIQFIGQVGLVQGVENAVVHQLNPVYHPLELQTQKNTKKKMRNTHMARGRKKRQKERAHRIDVNVEALAVPIFHVFPKEEHAIAGASLLGQINHRPAPALKTREFVIGDPLECSTYDWYLVVDRTVASFRRGVAPNVVN